MDVILLSADAPEGGLFRYGRTPIECALSFLQHLHGPVPISHARPIMTIIIGTADNYQSPVTCYRRTNKRRPREMVPTHIFLVPNAFNISISFGSYLLLLLVSAFNIFSMGSSFRTQQLLRLLLLISRPRPDPLLS